MKSFNIRKTNLVFVVSCFRCWWFAVKIIHKSTCQIYYINLMGSSGDSRNFQKYFNSTKFLEIVLQVLEGLWMSLRMFQESLRRFQVCKKLINKLITWIKPINICRDESQELWDVFRQSLKVIEYCLHIKVIIFVHKVTLLLPYIQLYMNLNKQEKEVRS